MSVDFTTSEIDVIRHAVILLQRDLKFDLVTFSRSGDLETVSHIVDSLSDIEFILNKTI